MASVEKLLEQMRAEPGQVRFADLRKVCEAYFGVARQSGGSHVVFKMPLGGRPSRENDRGKAKVYQVRQALAAIDKLLGERK